MILLAEALNRVRVPAGVGRLAHQFDRREDLGLPTADPLTLFLNKCTLIVSL